jgi:hypothetical protein
MKSIDVKLPHINKFLQFITHNNIIYVNLMQMHFHILTITLFEFEIVSPWALWPIITQPNIMKKIVIYIKFMFIYIFVIMSFNTSSNLIYLRKLIIFDTFILLLDFTNVIIALFHLLFLLTYQCCQLWKPDSNCNLFKMFKIGIFNPSFHVCLN